MEGGLRTYIFVGGMKKCLRRAYRKWLRGIVDKNGNTVGLIRAFLKEYLSLRIDPSDVHVALGLYLLSKKVFDAE